MKEWGTHTHRYLINDISLVLPELFTGEGSWDQWIAHFENVAAVNAWDDAAKLLWLRARLTKRAQTAYQKISQKTKSKCYGVLLEGLERI